MGKSHSLIFDSGYFKGKTILVTGGAGAIGRHLCERLVEFGAGRVIILDNLSSSYLWNIPDHENITFVKGDIRDENDLLRVFRLRPQIIFHLAAFFANQNSVDYPLINESVNVMGLIKVLEYARLTGCLERFVFTNSEGGAYGMQNSLPYQEDEISINLGSPYYISKLSGEAYCKYYNTYYNLPTTTVRLFNSYGPGEVPGQYRNVIPNFIYWALQKKPLPLTGSDDMARDFVYVQDIADGILRAAYFKNAIGRSYNIATGKAIKIHDLAHLINQKTGNTGGIKLLEARKWDQRPVLVGDITRSKTELGFEASHDFENGLDRTIEWFKNNWEQICASAEFSPGKNPALDVGPGIISDHLSGLFIN